MPSLTIDHYVINLDRSPDRLAGIEADAAALGLSLIRVPAVDGKSVPEAERRLLDLAGFRRAHGKQPMAGEYGCYMSHLRALEAIAAGSAEAGIVFEDDARPLPELLPVIQRLGEADDWDVVRFAHHRRLPCRTLRDLGHRRHLVAPFFGPTGSAAGYIVRRSAAGRLAQALSPMRLPFDVALERGWATGLRVLDIRPDLVRFTPLSKASLIREERGYGAMKLAPWRRLGALRFRTADAARRILYAAAKGRP